ncbi:MAG: hypothetical protein M3388_09995 [Acidobacteriota bacterium]|nr:hypothetical protein [Acidobacteriota bacterium]
MKNKKLSFFLFAVVFVSLTVVTFAQTNPLIKRTTYKTETVEFGVGGTVSIIGAPNGSIVVEGWLKNAVEISAEVEMQAATEVGLAELARVNGFVIDEDFGHIRITSVGTHDKNYMKRAAKKFPKNLLGLPFKIDYVIKVPASTDLQIDGGKGDLTLSYVEGAMRINFLESDVKLNLNGGSIVATFGIGAVEVVVPNRSWHSQSADIQLASGTMRVQLPLNLNAKLDARVLRGGRIENASTNLKPRDRTKFTEKSISANAGSGGAFLTFIVGNGTLKLVETEK